MTQPRESINKTDGVDEFEVVDKVPDKSADEALNYVGRETIPISPEEEKKVLRKIDWRLLPVLMVLNTMQLVDKNTLNVAATYGLIDQTRLQGQEYSLLVALFYIGYLIAEYPSNYLMQKFPTGKYLMVNFILWGAVLTLTGACKSFPGLAACRFLLGIFEAPINPGLVVISSTWWKTQEQPSRVQLWFCSAGFINLFMVLAFYGIAHIEVGSMFPYQWIFIIFGIFTVALGASLWWILPDSPMSCRFLNEREREVALFRIKNNQTGVKNKEHKRYQVWEAFKDPKVWLLTLGVFLQNMTNALQGSFIGLIIRGLGYDTYQSVLLTMPVSAVYGVSCLVVAWWLSTKWGKDKRIFTIMVCYLPGVISTTILYSVPTTQTAVMLFAVFFLNIISTNAGIMYSLLASNIAGYTKKSAVNSMFFICYSLGNIVSPQAFLQHEAPTYETGITVTLACFSLNIILFGVLYMIYKFSNKRRDKRAADLPAMDEDEKTRLAFSDLTDMENPNMRYST